MGCECGPARRRARVSVAPSLLGFSATGHPARRLPRPPPPPGESLSRDGPRAVLPRELAQRAGSPPATSLPPAAAQALRVQSRDPGSAQPGKPSARRLLAPVLARLVWLLPGPCCPSLTLPTMSLLSWGYAEHNGECPTGGLGGGAREWGGIWGQGS